MQAVNSNANWSPNSGQTLVSAVQARGSGNSIECLVGATSVIAYFNDTSPIPSGSTINLVTIIASSKGTKPGSSAVLRTLELQAAPGNVNTGPWTLTGAYADYSGIYTHALTRAQLQSSLLVVGVDGNTQDVFVEYLELEVDYTPPPDGLVTVYVAGAYPLDCGQPPPKRFHAFGIFDTADGLEQAVTAKWLLKYGKPPPGYVLWNYYRSANYGYTLGADSPITYWTVSPWPGPN